ncbi:MAG TPA: HPr kinase/phosphorylase [Caulobacteraceae bacterium]|nr:HPr kinase/phosphorylase [Caulobacteraceae bacterium]
MILHAGLIARRSGDAWRGVLIEGPSGSGKSDLALKALAANWILVADDRTLIWRDAGRLWGRAPDALDGLLEARGVGVVATRRLPFAEIALAIRCVEGAAIERVPEPQARTALGITLPLVALAPFEDSAVAKLERALAVLDSLGNRRIKRPAPPGGSPEAGGVA